MREAKLESQLCHFRERVSLVEEEGARARLYKEHLEGQRWQGDRWTNEGANKQDIRAPHPRSNIKRCRSLAYPPRFTLPYSNVHPYGMPPRWNANTGEQLTLEGHEKARMNNSRAGPTQGSGTGPTSMPEVGPHVQPTRVHLSTNLSGQTRPPMGT
ncbi:hypothetical protein CR513_30670, partial [Mucuna pruriens]